MYYRSFIFACKHMSICAYITKSGFVILVFLSALALLIAPLRCKRAVRLIRQPFQQWMECNKEVLCFLCNFAGMAFTRHGAVCASASAGTLSCLLVTDHADDRKRNYAKNRCDNQDVCQVRVNPFQHVVAS